jgi:hypothetical protein
MDEVVVLAMVDLVMVVVMVMARARAVAVKVMVEAGLAKAQVMGEAVVRTRLDETPTQDEVAWSNCS